MKLADVAVDTDATNDVIAYSNSNIYLENGTLASDYLSYTFSNTGNNHTNTGAPPSITVSPKKWFSTTRFYFEAKDNHGAVGKIYFKVGVTDQGINVKAADGAGKLAKTVTGSNGSFASGAQLDTHWRTATAADTSAYGSTGQVAANVRTLFIDKSISRGNAGGQKVMIRISDLFEDADNKSSPYTKDNVLIKAATKHNSSDETYNIVMGVDTAYGVAGQYYDYLVIEANTEKTNGGQYSSILVTYVARENGGSYHITQNDSTYVFRIVFKVDNTRPKLTQGKTVKVKAWESETVSLTSFMTDPDGNDLTISTVTPVIIPQYEFVQVDKYGALVDASTYGYNRNASGTPITTLSSAQQTEVLQKGYYTDNSMSTGFGQELIVQDSLYDPAHETYATYSISADRRSITVNGKRGSRSQYNNTRANANGHWYVLLHLIDAGETEDEGIWMPLAIEIENTAPTAASGNGALTMNVNDSIYLSPIGIGSFAVSEPQKNQVQAFMFGEDTDAFEVGGARNSFLYFPTGEKAQLTEGAAQYFELARVPIYIDKAKTAKLTQAEKNLLGLQAVAGNDTLVSITGLKLTAKKSTQQRYIEVPLSVADTMGLPSELVTQTLLLQVNNRMPQAIENDAYRQTTTDGEVTSTVVRGADGAPDTLQVKYTVHDGAVIAFSPYNFVTDPDLYNGGIAAEKTGQKFQAGSNAPITNTDIKGLYTTYAKAVPTRTDAGVAGTNENIPYDTLAFVFSDDQATEAKNHFGYTGKLETAYGKVENTYEYVRIVVRQRTLIGNPYRINFRIADGNRTGGVADHFVNVEITIDAVNYKPTLNPNLTMPALTASVAGDRYEEQPVYNVREYRVTTYTDENNSAVQGLATDPDSADVSSLAFYNTNVEVYTYNDSNEKEPLSGYVEAAVLATGTGSNLGYPVLYLKGLNSTQALPRGLYVSFYVTDRYDTANEETVSVAQLELQIEVVNSAPTMAEGTRFDAQEENGQTTYTWDISPQNPKNTADRYSKRYIAGSQAVYGYLTETDSRHTSTLVADADGKQHTVPYSPTNNAPTVALQGKNDTTAGVVIGNVYGGGAQYSWNEATATGTVSELVNSQTVTRMTVQLMYFTVDASGVQPFAGTKEERDEALENDSLHWALMIQPESDFMNTEILPIEIRLRDSKPEGGDTKGTAQGYYGDRNRTVAVAGQSIFRVQLKLSSVTFVNNIASYEGENGYYLYDTREKGTAGTDYDGYPYWYPNKHGKDGYTYGTVDVGKTGETYVPISYLAVPQTLQQDNTTKVSFAPNDGVTNITAAESDWKMQVTIADRAGNTWTGANGTLDNNPYLNIDISRDSAKFEASKYLNKNLYVLQGNEPTALRDGTTVANNVPKGQLYEDTVGLQLSKKRVRSSGELTVTVRLAQYSDTTVESQHAPQDIKFKVTVENDFLTLTKAVGKNTATFDAPNKVRTVELYSGANGLLDRVPTVETGDVTVRLFGANTQESVGTMAVNLLYSQDVDNGYDSGARRAYAETAYFSANAVKGLTQDDLKHIRELTSDSDVNAPLKYTDQDKDAIAEHFGFDDWNAFNGADLATVNARLNPNYTDYFDVIPSNDSAYLTVRPKIKTQLSGLTQETCAQYGLKYNAQAQAYYYPLKTLVYDDYMSTGWLQAAYEAVELRVYVYNTAPRVAIGEADDVNNPTAYTYSLDIRKGTTATFYLTTLFGDSDMQVFSADRKFYAEGDYDSATGEKKELRKAAHDWPLHEEKVTETIDGQSVQLTAQNGIVMLKAPSAEQQALSVECDLSDTQLTFTANERVNGKVLYTVRFYDSTGVGSATLTFEITVTNQTPTVYRQENMPVTSIRTTTVELEAGQYFTVLTTPWDRFVSGVRTEQGIDTAAKLENHANLYNSYKMYTDGYKAGSDAAGSYNKNIWNIYPRLTSGSLAITETGIRGSYALRSSGEDVNEGPAGNRGYLALGDDDTPWGLRFIGFTATDAFTVASMDYMRTEGNQQDRNYCLSYRITARYACNNVALRFTMTDGEGANVEAVIRVTVKSSVPQKKDYADEKEMNGYTIVSVNNDANAAEYNVRMQQGDRAVIEMNDLATDTDVDNGYEVLRLNSDNGQVFTVDTVKGNGNGNIRLGAFGTYMTVEALAVNTNVSGKTTVTFSIVDGSGNSENKLDVTLNVYILPQDPTAEKGLQEVTVKSVSEYRETGTADSLGLFMGYGDDTYAMFDDPDCKTDALYYGVTLYANYDRLGNPTEDKTAIATFASDNGVWRFTLMDNALAETAERYFTVGVTDGGRTLTFVPRRSTQALRSKGLLLTVEVRKTLTYDSGDGIDKTVSAQYLIGVANSGVEAVGDTPLNYGYMQEGRRYLTFDARVGDTVTYDITGKDREDFGLFKDVDIVKDENGKDIGDVIQVAQAEVRAVAAYGDETATQGYEEDKEKGLPAAFGVKVADGKVSITVVRKPSPFAEEATQTLLIEVTGRDAETSVTTVITIYVTNSAPTFKTGEHEGYTVTRDMLSGGQEGYVIDLRVAAGESKVLTLDDILADADYIAGNYATEAFTFMPVQGAESMAISAISGKPNEEQVIGGLFRVRVSDENNSKILIDGKTTARGASGEIWLSVMDGSGAETAEPLVVRMQVVNSAPYVLSDADTTVRIMSREVSEGVNASTTVHILDYIGDDNEKDAVDPAKIEEAAELSETYVRIVSYEADPVDKYVEADDGNQDSSVESTSGMIVQIGLSRDDEYNQKLFMRPIAGRYGRQTVRVYITDDGNDIMNTDALTVVLTLTVEVSRNIGEIVLNNIDDLRWKTTSEEVTPRSLLIDRETGEDYSVGYAIDRIVVDAANEKRISVIKTEDETGTHWFVRADGAAEGRIPLYVYFNVAGVAQETPKVFTANITENRPPVLNETFETEQMIYMGNFEKDTYTIRYAVSDILTDPDDNELRIVSAKSSQNLLVSAAVEEDGKVLALTFKASGAADITLEVTDATERPRTYVISVRNPDLPEPNMFIGIWMTVTSRWPLFLGIAIGILVLLILLIILLAVRRHKKRVQAEVEALLVSEMQLEEQMMKLAAAQNAYNNYALPPVQPPLDTNMLLGGAPNANPNNPALGLSQPSQGAPDNTLGLPPAPNNNNFNPNDF